jgi:hypothetical protein
MAWKSGRDWLALLLIPPLLVIAIGLIIPFIHNLIKGDYSGLWSIGILAIGIIILVLLNRKYKAAKKKNENEEN